MIPLIGQPVDIKMIHIQCVIYCNCQPKDRNLMLLNVGQATVCPLCGNTYILTGLQGVDNSHVGVVDIKVLKQRTQ